MNESDFDDLYALEEDLWWFAGMRDVTASLLDRIGESSRVSILDAGCGTGLMLSWLRRYAQDGSIVGLDLEEVALRYCRLRGQRLLTRASVVELPFGHEAFDLVTSFDVLTQLPNDGSDELAIREIRRVLRPGGVAFVRAPAYEWMRSDHDRALGIQHRYALRELSLKVEGSGLQVVRATYANSLLLPVAAFRRLILKRLGLASPGSDVRRLPPGLAWANRLLRAVLRAEAWWLGRQRSRLPFGLSCICVAQRPADPLRN